MFTTLPDTVVPSRKKARGADAGTVWRRANWAFYERAARELTDTAVVLDVGCGQGDFKPLFAGKRYVAIDFYPYDDVDVVCDLAKFSPLRPSSVDAIVLSNVLEHVLDGQTLLRRLSASLRPGGRLLIAVPFMIKLHQVPHDYVRYTHFALQAMLEEAGLRVVRCDAVLAPGFLVRATAENMKRSLGGGGRPFAARLLLGGVQRLARLSRRVGAAREPEIQDVLTKPLEADPYPVGYQIEAHLPADAEGRHV